MVWNTCEEMGWEGGGGDGERGEGPSGGTPLNCKTARVDRMKVTHDGTHLRLIRCQVEAHLDLTLVTRVTPREVERQKMFFRKFALAFGGGVGAKG